MSSEHRKYEQYRPASKENLSTRELQFGEWWTKRRPIFRNTLVAILLLIGVGGIGLGLYTVGHYFVVGRQQAAREAQQLVRPKVSFIQYHESLAPADPEFGAVDVLPATEGLYDFVTFATNPNEEWYLTFTYTFQFDGGETESKKMMLIPGEEAVVADLGFKSDTRPGSPVINVTDLRWHRISPHEAPDPAKYIHDHTDIGIRDIQFISGSVDTENPLAIKSHRITFTVENKTPYNFRSIPIYIVLSQASSIRTIERTEILGLKTGEIRSIDVRSVKADASVSKVDVRPYLPIFDESLYLSQ